VEYSLDEQNKVAMLVWQYRHTPDVFGGAMGYVQRLDDGSTLIGWGAANPTVTEVTPDGEVLFELSYPFGVFSYRAYMFAPDTTTAGVFAGRETPSEFVLAQNYPNPFNPKTVVSYQLPEVSAVRLVIYDMLGREVEALVNETQAAGNYKVGFDASALSSGVYLYQLTAGRFVEARKMLLLR
jgi:hypothetical protein